MNLLSDAHDQMPIIAKVKVGDDKNPSCALVQLLMYASESEPVGYRPGHLSAGRLSQLRSRRFSVVLVAVVGRR
jgi:hypothetical protein